MKCDGVLRVVPRGDLGGKIGQAEVLCSRIVSASVYREGKGMDLVVSRSDQVGRAGVDYLQ